MTSKVGCGVLSRTNYFDRRTTHNALGKYIISFVAIEQKKTVNPRPWQTF